MNNITVIGFDKNRMSSNPVHRNFTASRHIKKNSTLHIIGIGVSKYKNLPKSFQLQYAHSDVNKLSLAFEQKFRHNFGSVKKTILANSKATRKEIKKAFDSLKNMKKSDVAVIHLAGHGIRSKNNNFYFLTSEITDTQYRKITDSFDAVETLDFSNEQSGMINWSFFEEVFSTTKGQILLFLDACHSADLVRETITPNTELANRLFSQDNGGVFVFSASKGRQTALEYSELGSGLFTDSIVSALTKPNIADVNEDGYLDLMELVTFVVADVKKRSDQSQTPWLSKKTMFGNILLTTTDQKSSENKDK